MELISSTEMEVVNNPITNANNTNDTTDAIDMQGYRCCMIAVPITDSANNGKAELQIEDSANGTSGWTRLAMDEVSATADAADALNGKLLRAEIKFPLKRYFRGRLRSSAGNIAFGPVISMKGKAFREPVVGDGDVLAEEVVASPVAHS